MITDINLNSPNKGLGTNDLSDVPVEGAVGNAERTLPPGMTEEEAEEPELWLPSMYRSPTRRTWASPTTTSSVG